MSKQFKRSAHSARCIIKEVSSHGDFIHRHRREDILRMGASCGIATKG